MFHTKHEETVSYQDPWGRFFLILLFILYANILRNVNDELKLVSESFELFSRKQ
jgi:hypothetical protein